MEYVFLSVKNQWPSVKLLESVYAPLNTNKAMVFALFARKIRFGIHKMRNVSVCPHTMERENKIA